MYRTHQYRTPVERNIFALVADRALAPSSKLAMEDWVAQQVLIDGLEAVEVHQLYRTMDFLLEASEAIQHDVFFSVANLLNLEVDLLFFDTTTTYFEVEDEDQDRDGQEGLRKRGCSKDSRSDLAQVVIAFAVTRTGIPVRCWVWPGHTSDQTIVEQTKKDLNGWQLGRVVFVADTGFNSGDNRRFLQGAGGQYILGERLRVGSKGAPVEALQRGGKYRVLDNGLEFKEILVNPGSAAHRRFILVRNPKQAERDRQKRDDIVAEAQRRLDALNQMEGEPDRKAACELRSHPAFGRYIRQTKTGLLRLDQAKIQAEARLDGKFLISTSDDGLAAEDVAAGYKQLAEIERVFRDLKHRVDIRPVYHRLEDRIKAHVLLCWLALLLIRVAENETGETWFQIKRILQPLKMGIHRTRSGEVWQTSAVTSEQKALFGKLHLDAPPRYYRVSANQKETV